MGRQKTNYKVQADPIFTLKTLAALVSQFVSDPLQKDKSLVPPSGHLKNSTHALRDYETVNGWIDELVSESAKVRDLQEQIDNS